MTMPIVMDFKNDEVHASMDEVITPKTRLIEKLKENRDRHRAEFEAAIAGYKTRCIELLEEHIERIKSGTVEQVLVSIPCPRDHTDEYNSAIEMLEWSVIDTAQLDARQFNQYVLDQWNWKQEFSTTNAMYSQIR